MASVIHPDPTKLVGKISHLYIPSFVYGQVTPKTVPIHPGLWYYYTVQPLYSRHRWDRIYCSL